MFSPTVLARPLCLLSCAAIIAGATPAGAAPRVRGDDIVRGRRAAGGEALVRMRAGTPARATLADPLGDVENEEPIAGSRWRLVRSRTRTADVLARILAARGDVEAAEPNYAVRVAGAPDDLAAPLWALQNTGQLLPNGDRGTPGVDLDATHAWDVTQGSRRVVVATLDTGVALGHRDLAANLWTAPRAFTVTVGGLPVSCPAGSHGFNVVDRTCDPSDDNGHGTHVAGSIGAVGNNASGVVGINWQTSLMPLKFMDASGNGYISDAMLALEFAIQVKQLFASTGEADVRVLNNSWTGGGYSQALHDQVVLTHAAGMLFVAAAGNGGIDHDASAVYPSDYEGANILSVTSTDYRDQLGATADTGAAHVHLAAPGVLIQSTGWTASDPVGFYESRSGTSMAAAYTSGVAALVLSHCTYGPGALRDALLRTAVPVSALAGRTASAGRVNAASAVRSCDGATGNVDTVMHASVVPAADRHGHWMRVADATAADGVALSTPDAGWAATTAPLAHPAHYVDIRVPVRAGLAYRIWLRLKAGADSKWNDSVWLQFSDARVNGASAFAINTAGGLAVNLEDCSGCGVGGWGWQDGAYWVAQTPVTFGHTGIETVRVQTREDGMAFDQVVVSAAAWFTTPPGQVRGDSTLLSATGTGGTAAGGPASSTPFSGAPIAIPGTVQAEWFDEGGEGVAFHDSDPGNIGGAFRSGGVDIEATSGGGQNVGWIAAGEWLAYSVDVAAAGAYTASFRLASYGAGGTFHLEVNGANLTGPLTVPDTGWWQNWQVITRTLTLAAGRQRLTLVFDTAPAGAVGNLDWFSLATAASGTSASALPGRLLAVNFDAGGEGAAYHDDSPGNSGGSYRTTDVDIEPCAEGGFNVGWIGAGEWLRFTVDVASAGSYRLELRVAAPGGGGSLHVALGGGAVTGTVAVPATGSWQSWTTIAVPATLPAGRQTLTLHVDTPGFNLRYLDVVAP